MHTSFAVKETIEKFKIKSFETKSNGFRSPMQSTSDILSDFWPKVYDFEHSLNSFKCYFMILSVIFGWIELLSDNTIHWNVVIIYISFINSVIQTICKPLGNVLSTVVNEFMKVLTKVSLLMTTERPRIWFEKFVNNRLKARVRHNWGIKQIFRLQANNS